MAKKGLLTETAERLKKDPGAPSRLLRHPYFAEQSKKRWHNVTSWHHMRNRTQS